MPTISEILKSKITKDGKSKTYVANELKVTEKTIENYMNGTREPKNARLLKLANLLGFSLSEITSESGGSEQNVPLSTKFEEGQIKGNNQSSIKEQSVLERLLEEKEARRLETSENLKRLQEVNDRLMKMIEDYLSILLTNSDQSQLNLETILLHSRAFLGQSLDNEDQMMNQKKGTSTTKAGNAELDARARLRKVGKKNQGGAGKSRTGA